MMFSEHTDERGDFLSVVCTGGSFLIDAADRVALGKWTWNVYAPRSRHCQYVARTGKGHTVLLHRELMNPPAGLEVDHEDGSGVNNRRYNLRLLTHAQNVWSHHNYKRTGSGLIGAYPVGKRVQRWEALIKAGGKMRYLGTFDTAEEAARCRDKEVYRLRGEFAVLNYPDELKQP